MLSRLADRLVLCPSTNRISIQHKNRRTIEVGEGEVEVWIERTDGRAAPTILPSVTGRIWQLSQLAFANGNGQGTGNGRAAPPEQALPEPQIFVLKFNGAGGRAERTSIHPLDFWSDFAGEVWSPNPPGYGASRGAASLRWLAPTGRAVFQELLAVAGSRPIVISGNSLGTAVALHVAAHFAEVPNLAAVILRNPPPLRELIIGKFGWRTLGLSRLVAWQIPPELDSISNAARVRQPCVFLCSGCDRIVPPRYQQLVRAAYAGEAQVVHVPDANHVFDLDEPVIGEYGRALLWLREKAGLNRLGSEHRAFAPSVA